MGKRQLKGLRFNGIDLIASMELIVLSHMDCYQSDFYEHDILTLERAMESTDPADRSFIWLCRKCGTWLLSEKDTLIKPSHAYITLCFYEEQGMSDEILAFAVDVTYMKNGRPIGNLSLMDYRSYCQHVREKALDAGSLLITYEHGEIRIPPDAHIPHSDGEMGNMKYYEMLPQSEEELSWLLAREKEARSRYREGDFLSCMGAKAARSA